MNKYDLSFIQMVKRSKDGDVISIQHNAMNLIAEGDWFKWDDAGNTELIADKDTVRSIFRIEKPEPEVLYWIRPRAMVFINSARPIICSVWLKTKEDFKLLFPNAKAIGPWETMEIAKNWDDWESE